MTFPIVTTQSPKSQTARISLSDLTSAVALGAFTVPIGAVNIEVKVDVVTAFDSGTSDVAVVDLDVDGHTFLSSTTIAATGLVSMTGQYTGGPLTAEDTLNFTWTGAGTAATVGEVDVTITYNIDGRADEVVG